MGETAAWTAFPADGSPPEARILAVVSAFPREVEGDLGAAVMESTEKRTTSKALPGDQDNAAAKTRYPKAEAKKAGRSEVGMIGIFQDEHAIGAAMAGTMRAEPATPGD